MDKKNIIIGILGIACIILSYMAFKPVPLPDNSSILARIDSLTAQNKRLLANADHVMKNNTILKASNDSLMKLPPQIKTKYISISKQIDRLDNRDIKDTLNSIFTQNNVDTTKGDTMLYISPSESKYLIKEHYHNGELTDLLKVEQDLNHNLQAEVKNDSLALSDYLAVLVNDQEAGALKDQQIQNLNTIIKSKDKKLTRQKVFKWLAVAAGAVGTGYMTYMNFIRR